MKISETLVLLAKIFFLVGFQFACRTMNGDQLA